MRNRFFLSALGKLFTGPKWASARPDVLLKQALLFNSLLMLGAVAIAYPVAFYMLTQGLSAPAVLVTAGLALAALALVFHMRRAFEWELTCQVVLITLVGSALSLADPDIFDFGLAITLMATLMALLMSQSRRKHLAWLAPVIAIAMSVGGYAGHIPNPFTQNGPDWLFLVVTVYLAAALVVAVTANRLNTAALVRGRSNLSTFSLLVESVKDAVVRYGANGSIFFLSRSAADLFNCQRYELDGNGFFERVHVMDRPAYLAALSDASKRGLHTSVEVRMRRDGEGGKAARFIWVELSLSPVIDDAEAEVREILGIIRDISDRKQAEGKLEKARVDAEEASLAKSRFLATVGHELRTPLNAIVGFSDMMHAGIGGEPSPQHKEYAALISQSGHHLLDVVNMLLDMSKIEAGKFEVQAEPFMPASLIEPCTQIVDKAARDRGIALKVEIPAALPTLVADERACRQILINLLSNAVKFSHDGGVVRLAMKRQGKMLLISVSDSGIGMKPETVSRVGEPFLQAQDGLTRRYEGTGLGLSIVKGLVGLHRGRLDIASAPGMGTTVSVLLPLDGPESTHGGTIEPLHTPRPTPDDETKWLQDEKRSAAR
ncbi:PAS domain-containing sensor histidine kinase [Pelagibacterium limicola]|uniref:PAS domain-containing sensor histidine kinase n=1 Tax=Pelagibacterium limicola TaxID=2791022 RepID=UPI0018AFD29D|nr:PAS domain-containing sensor histidine kinase [Pelagibacterium limicola]